MNMLEALKKHNSLKKHVDGPVPGTETISAANFSGGYYKDFIPDDPKKRQPVCTSTHWYMHELKRFYSNDEGWEPEK